MSAVDERGSAGGRLAGEPLLVQVRLFAMLRESAGAATIELSLDPGATVADAMRRLGECAPLGEVLGRVPVCMAVNRQYAQADTRLERGDELALIPPLSGGAGLATDVHVRLSEEPLSFDAVRDAVADPRAGAIVVFAGVTRAVPLLEYEAYTAMAGERIEQIARDCGRAHELCALAVEHRVGSVPLGDPAVIVAASAPHRPAAFAAAREAIDRVKAEAPIWKRELGADGSAAWTPGRLPDLPRATAAAAPESQAPGPSEPRLTHVGSDGAARMVDVGGKDATLRTARASARVRMSPRAARAVAAGDGPKGEVLGVARIAGIQAAKQTAHLIPLAHPIALTFVDVTARVDERVGLVSLTSEARTRGQTGVEMEAMTACAVAALTVYDMVKGLERGVALEDVVLEEKRGGRSDFVRED